MIKTAPNTLLHRYLREFMPPAVRQYANRMVAAEVLVKVTNLQGHYLTAAALGLVVRAERYIRPSDDECIYAVRISEFHKQGIHIPNSTIPIVFGADCVTELNREPGR
ncbi:hypothetical protein vBValSX1_129 [Vibrio phage vB_ValS_X1]|uniref:Uncharacterized protein n=1 Tax=Vibrio phage vB_ValS_X1 TaxID=2736341 RepID=A0A6M9Z786_9CAUD|nr:hypothetical protein vBValSX1_129 [Vibrio phage vB_ValS_X1]